MGQNNVALWNALTPSQQIVELRTMHHKLESLRTQMNTTLAEKDKEVEALSSSDSENARMALIGVATEANDAMKRVVAQTSRVEAFVRKHENEDRRLRAEQEYKHLKEVQQTQRLNQAHKMKSLLGGVSKCIEAWHATLCRCLFRRRRLVLQTCPDHDGGGTCQSCFQL